MSPFEFVNAICFSKQDLFEDPLAEKDYSPFLINRALSYFPDTVLYANVMNGRGHIPKQRQFDFLRNTITKRKRFSKWAKKDSVSEDLAAVCEFYKYSTSKGLEALSILNNAQIVEIKESLHKGGRG